MRRASFALTFVITAWIGAIGCNQADKQRPMITPPKEDFHIPPPGLAAQPTKYPEGMLNHVPIRKQDDDDADKLPPVGGPGMGGGAMPGGPGTMGR